MAFQPRTQSTVNLSNEAGGFPEESTLEFASDSDSSKTSTPATRQKLNDEIPRDGPLIEVDERVPLLNPRQTISRIRIPSIDFDSSSHQYTCKSRSVSLKSYIYRNQAGLSGGTLASAFDQKTPVKESNRFTGSYERTWYDQFTSTDWVYDSVADAHRTRKLKFRKDIQGRLKFYFDGCGGYTLSALVGVLTAIIAYLVNIFEAPLEDWKMGYCSKRFYLTQKQCCLQENLCNEWKSWSDLLNPSFISKQTLEFLVFVSFVTIFSTLACLLTLTTKISNFSRYRITNLSQNVAASNSFELSSGLNFPKNISDKPPATTNNYPVSGSGVAEVRVILSGFVLHGFLGVKTLIIKCLALVLSISSGLSIGKEGPFVHIATCIGNITCRLSSKYGKNDGKLREVLSAAAAAGVAVAFGAPIGAVLFSLEEVAFFFPAKTLFRTFFCSITAALTLKFLNPFGTHKIVMFEVRYYHDWQFFEIIAFILIGILGGGAGAIFIKASRFWAYTFRPLVRNFPLLEVFLVALLTGVISFWNPLTKISITKLLYNIASPCSPDNSQKFGLCPLRSDSIKTTIINLGVAFLIKAFLTLITFGIKVPAGIYVPSMVVGGLGGRIIGHTMQILVLRFSNLPVFKSCAADSSGLSCITPGVYALIAAGSMMCGVTRLSVTLAVILFEITGSLDYILPCSLAILVAKWTADAIESQSIYDLVTEINSYPLLDNKKKPIFMSELSSIVPRTPRERVIDISTAAFVPAYLLQKKLDILHKTGEFDGALPITRNDMLVGLLPAPDLEFVLDNIKEKANTICLMTKNSPIDVAERERYFNSVDLNQYIDSAPLSLDIHSSMDLVYQCFVKLGLRYICILQEGRYIGMIHKKAFVHYTREVSKIEGYT